MKKCVAVLLGFALAVAIAGTGFWLAHRFIDSKEQQERLQNAAESVWMKIPELTLKRDEREGDLCVIFSACGLLCGHNVMEGLVNSD